MMVALRNRFFHRLPSCRPRFLGLGLVEVVRLGRRLGGEHGFQFLVDARQQHRLGVDHRDQPVDIEVRRGQQIVGIGTEDVHDVRRSRLEGRGDGAGLHRALAHRQCWTTRTLGLAVGHSGVIAGRETAAEPVNSICRATSHSGHGPAAIVTARDHRAVTSIRVPHVVGSNPSARCARSQPPRSMRHSCGASAPVASACSVTPSRAVGPDTTPPRLRGAPTVVGPAWALGARSRDRNGFRRVAQTPRGKYVLPITPRSGYQAASQRVVIVGTLGPESKTRSAVVRN